MANNYCVECGKKLEEDFKVCPYCGKKIVVERKTKYCHLCGIVLNEDGKCPVCNVEKEVVGNETNMINEETTVMEEPKKFNIFGLLSFVFAMLSVLVAMIREFVVEGTFNRILLFSFVILQIPAFILQFFGRKKNTKTVWKVFSWIAFGVSCGIM